MSGVDLHDVLTEYQVSGWTLRDGLPPGAVNALAQDNEGYLWVGTENGLFRFDGVRFTHATVFTELPLLKLPARALLLARDGSLWVGTGDNGGVARLHDGRWSAFGEADGVGREAVSFLRQDVSARLWAGTAEGLFRFDGTRWQRETRGLPDGPAFSAHSASSGDLIVGMSNGIFRLRPGTPSFERIESFAFGTPFFYESPRSLAEDDSGHILVTDGVFGFRSIGAAPTLQTKRLRGRGRQLLRDRQQNLWVGTNGQGLWRVRAGTGQQGYVTERLTALTGLLSDGVRSLLEDRDGNLWVGTSEGLNRLTRPRVSQITDIGLVIGVESTPDAAVWVGTVDELLKYTGSTNGSPALRISMQGTGLRAMDSDRAGGLWIATSTFIGHVVADRLIKMPIPGGQHEVDSISSDGFGGLWMHDWRGGLSHWHGGRLDRWPLPERLRLQRVSAAFVDSTRRTWLAFADGLLLAISHDGTYRVYGEGEGADGGPYRSIHEHGDGVLWFAGANGLTRLAQGRFETVRRGPGFPLELTALIDDGASELYLGTNLGIARVSEDDFDRALTGGHFAYTLYDRADGLAGLPLAYSTNRRAIRGSDNRLWFLTARGLTVLEPRALRQSRGPSPVHIESLIAEDQRYGPTPGLSLPPGTSRIEISYTTLDLTSPLRTRFRYMLEGFDTTWINAGRRRQAYYTNLPPGRYHFHVIASGLDGISDASRATWAFSIEPMFYQAGWFYGFVAASIGLAITSAWRLHLRQVRHQFSLLLRERARLSREIHDTLLQSLVGLALKLDASGREIASVSEKARDNFVGLRRELEDHIREARQSIWNLRSASLDHGDFVTALRDVGTQVTGGWPTRFTLTMAGSPRQFPERVEEHLLRIGREAITNAVRHARAREVRVHVAYEATAVVLRVADDGEGFDSSRLWTDHEAANHYGLIGMKERAEEVGGALSISSSATRGTEITTVVPLR